MTDQIQAFDEFNNPVYPLTINTICPVQFAEEGAEQCLAYMQNGEGAVGMTLSEMLTGKLSPVGIDHAPITHVFCSRVAYSHQANRLSGYLANLDHPQIASRIMTLNDDPVEVKSKLCVMVGDKAQVLSFLGLREAV